MDRLVDGSHAPLAELASNAVWANLGGQSRHHRQYNPIGAPLSGFNTPGLGAARKLVSKLLGAPIRDHRPGGT